MASAKCINDLPNEMLVEIFANVSFEDLVHSIQHVCTRWQEASRDTLLWRDRVYIPEYKDSDSKIASVLEQTPKLETLIIDQRGVQSVVVRTITNHCTHLKKLMFSKYYQKLSIADLKNLVQKCPNIECFNMPRHICNIFEKVEIIGQFRNLVHLSLGGWPDNPVPLKPLADGCPSLRSIDLKNKTYLSGDLEYFLLKKKDQLHTLSVRWSTADFKSTISLLSVCTALKTLHLVSYCDVNVEESFQALRSLTMVTSLTVFDLSYANVNNFISVFQNRAMDQLVELHLKYYYNYTDKLGAVIVKNCPQLKLLYFKECYDLTDQSVKNFHTLHELQYVSLNGTKISDVGMESIRKCKNLKYLSLNSCGSLTERSMKLMTELSGLLQSLILDKCDIKGLPMHLISSHLKHLTLLSINHSRNVDQEALAQLKIDKPDLVIQFKVENNDGPVEIEDLDILVDAAHLFEQLDESRV